MLSWVSSYAKPPYWERDLANESEVSFWFVFKDFAHLTTFQVALKINRYVFSIVLLTVSLLLLAKAHWKSRYSARCRKQLNIAGFPHRNQEAAVRWSSRRFGLSIRKEGQLQLLDLLNSVLGRAGKSRNSKNISCLILALIQLSQISFLLRSINALLSTTTNLKQWAIIDGNTCRACISKRATLEHVLAACVSWLQKYTWGHNLVLTVLNITQVVDIKFLDITKTS